LLFNKTYLIQAVIPKAIKQPLIRMELNDTATIRLLKERNEKGFEQVFKTHFKNLHLYACTILKDPDLAEDTVQNVFYKLWEKIEGLTFSGSVAAYLYTSVYHESLNCLKHQKIKIAHRSHIVRQMNDRADSAPKKVLLDELERRLQTAINDLPEQCRTIFQLSRFEELRYREISDRLGISIKTVENQMGKALKILRTKLIDFLPLILLSLLNILNYLT
jgi:RNA polymerase sigma-70 factor, ECF subfamily